MLFCFSPHLLPERESLGDRSLNVFVQFPPFPHVANQARGSNGNKLQTSSTFSWKTCLSQLQGGRKGEKIRMPHRGPWTSLPQPQWGFLPRASQPQKGMNRAYHQKGWQWMNLENIMLVKEASHKRPRRIRFHLYIISRIGKSIGIESTLVVCKTLGTNCRAVCVTWRLKGTFLGG